MLFLTLGLSSGFTPVVHRAFQPVTRTDPPAVEKEGWSQDDIDGHPSREPIAEC
ncbi:MAG: hypothetical protein AAF492_02025 [Verrucomicrobiota bacterium]